MSRTKKKTPAPEAPKIQTMNIEPVRRMAEKLRAQILGGMLYGERIDPNDIDALIVAAYYMGQREARREYPVFDLEQLRNGSE